MLGVQNPAEIVSNGVLHFKREPSLFTIDNQGGYVKMVYSMYKTRTF